MKLIALLVLPLAALPLALRAAPAEKKTRILRKGSYRFEVVTDSRVGEWFGWWGAPDSGRVNVISAVKAFRAEQRLSLPPSVFAGLADAHDFTLRQTGRGMELVIVGSDAGKSWKGVFLFNRPGILERTIRSGEFPDLVNERTTYRYLRIGEID